MDEKHQSLTEPLLSTGKHDLPMTTTPQPQPRQSKWKRFAFWGGVFASIYLVKSSVVSFANFKAWSSFDELDSHSQFAYDEGDHDHVNCVNVTEGSEWITLDKSYFTSSSPFSYNITTSAPFIKILSRGPIVGNVTLEVGGTKGDDIEVDVEFVKAGRHRDRDGHKFLPHIVYDVDGPHEVPSHPPDHPHPHPWPAPPKVKICPFYTDKGEIRGLGIFAYREEKHEHHPHQGRYSKRRHHGLVDWSAFRGDEGDHPNPGHPHPGPPCHGNPHHPTGRPALATVHIRFPSSSSFSPLALDAFETSLPGFMHIVHDLSGVMFQRLSFFTAHRPVFVKKVTAKVVKVLAFGGPIFGQFEVGKWLDLVSVGRPVGAKVTLFGRKHEKWGDATGFRAVAINSFVYSNVTLVDATADDESSVFAPAYFIKTVSSDGQGGWRHPQPHPHPPHGPHGPHHPPAGFFHPAPPHHHSGTILNVIEQPTNSTLVVFSHARGVTSPVLIKLHAAFQGAFNLFSAGARPSLEVTEGAKDPSGEGRKRVVVKNRTWSPWKISGVAKWVKEEKEEVASVVRSWVKGHKCGRSLTATIEEELEGFSTEGKAANDGEEGPHDAFGRIQVVGVRAPAKLVIDAF